jgi:hypothetical protein
MHTVCGLLMHSNLAVTTEGLPLGLAAIKFWTRQKFKGTAALKKKINPTRVPIEHKESIRWLENMRQSITLFGEPARFIHVGDRESDIYELFCTAQELGTHFLVRSCVDRLAGHGDHTITDEMNDTEVAGRHHVEVCDSKGRVDAAAVEIRLSGRRGATQNRGALGEAHLGFLHPELASVLDDHDQSLGAECRARPRVDRGGNRASRPPVPDKDDRARCEKTLSSYLTKIARLGGYLARASDPPPGNTVMWRGLSRLTDIKLGATLSAGLVGN